MKKIASVLLVLAVLFSFAACSSGDKVTIYIPETLTIQSANQAVLTTVDLVFEEGWESKKSFTVTYSGNLQGLGVVPKMTYSDKGTVTEMEGVSRTEVTYDENGRSIAQNVVYLNGLNMERTEMTFVYDEHGRRLEQETKTYYADAENPNVDIQTYVYEETADGSEGRFTDSRFCYVLTYDKDYRLVKQVMTANEKELSHVENTYDSNGNLLSTTSYVNGQIVTVMTYTYKAVEVSRETADRLPHFKRG